MSMTFLANIRNAYASRHEPEQLRPLAVAFWRSLLVTTVALVLLVIAGGVWEFVTVITTLNDTDSGVATPTPALDRAQLQAILEAYDERVAEFDALSEDRPVFENPSAR